MHATAEPMRTLGVDFAAQPTNTAACVIAWFDGKAVVEQLVRPVDDKLFIDLTDSVDKVGVDVPFGWPDAFVSAVIAHTGFEHWPPTTVHALRFRRTDLFVQAITGTWPLSVSTDRIGIAAFRAARLFSGRGIAREGAGKVVEVYPRAARYRFQTDATVDDVVRKAPWLELDAARTQQCSTDDHCFDALIAALTARAAALNMCEPVPLGDREAARREGWIALPLEDSLQRLP